MKLDHPWRHRRLYRQQDRQQEGGGLVLDIVLGIVGAVVGGLIFSAFGASGVTGLNIYSLIVAVLGSVVVLWAYHQFTGNRAL